MEAAFRACEQCQVFAVADVMAKTSGSIWHVPDVRSSNDLFWIDHDGRPGRFHAEVGLNLW